MEENKNEEVKEEVVTEQENCKEDTELNAVKTELEETTDRLKRLMAEFDNFKKEVQKKEKDYTILYYQI